MKKQMAWFLISGVLVSQGVYAMDIPTAEVMSNVALEFASQYPYKDGDTEKSFSLYPDTASSYTSGIETRNDGVDYECPAIYNDKHAAYFNDYDLKKGKMTIEINGIQSACSDECILYNGTTLVPVDVFKESGCEVTHNDKLYVTKFQKNGTTIEVLPYLIGMRKNEAAGYWIPLEACARYVDNELYVPVRAIAQEFGINVEWCAGNYTVKLTY